METFSNAPKFPGLWLLFRKMSYKSRLISQEFFKIFQLFCGYRAFTDWFRIVKDCYFHVILLKQPQEVFSKKRVLKCFTKCTGKHLRQSLFFNKVADNFIRKDTLALVFSCEFLQNFYEHLCCKTLPGDCLWLSETVAFIWAQK